MDQIDVAMLRSMPWAKSKILLSLQVGPRKQWVAHALVHSLVGVMAPGYVPLYTSDGLAMYFYALTAHYGSYQELEGKRKPHWVVSELLQYAQMKKHRVWRKLKRIEIRVQCGGRDAINQRLVSMGLRATVQFVGGINHSEQNTRSPTRQESYFSAIGNVHQPWQWAGRAIAGACRK